MTKRSSVSETDAAGQSGMHEPQGSVRTVLHVDDDPNDTELLRAAVRKAGLELNLQNVEDAEHAIAYLSGQGIYADRAKYCPPCMVLLDLKMPRVTGFDVLNWIRRQPEAKHLPVVVLSGSELQDDIRQAYAAGANSYLVKPLGFEALVQMVRQIHAAWTLSVVPGVLDEGTYLSEAI